MTETIKVRVPHQHVCPVCRIEYYCSENHPHLPMYDCLECWHTKVRLALESLNEDEDDET